MPTKLYFRVDAPAVTGTLPSGEQSTTTPSWTATGATTLETLSTAPGSSQTSNAGSTTNTTATQTGFLGIFVSPPIVGATTVGGGSAILFAAEQQSNTNANFRVNAINAYVWRPSTGAKVGTIVDNTGSAAGGTAPTAQNSEQTTYITGIATSAVSAQTGDVVVVEAWARFAQSMATSYTATFFYGGTTESTTENQTISSAASYFQLAENLSFDASQSITTVAGTGQAGSIGEGTTVAISGNDATTAVGSVAQATSLTGVQADDSIGEVGAGPSSDLSLSLINGTVLNAFPLNDSGVVAGDKTAALTGVSGAATAGSVNNVNAKAVTTVAGTGAVGSVGEINAQPLTGNAATGAVGAIGEANTNPTTGTTGTGTAGTVGASYTRALTGLSASGAVGTVSVTGDAQVGITGAAATGAAGTVSRTTTKALSGNAATPAAGTLQTTAQRALTGTAGSGAVNTPTSQRSKTLSGTTATGATGTVSSAAGSGAVGTGQAGDLTASRTVGLSGAGAAGQAGAVNKSAAPGLSGSQSVGDLGAFGRWMARALAGQSTTLTPGNLSADIYGSGASDLVAYEPPAVCVAYVEQSDNSAKVEAEATVAFVLFDETEVGVYGTYTAVVAAYSTRVTVPFDPTEAYLQEGE